MQSTPQFKPPRLVAASKDVNRPDQESTFDASEYLDDEDALMEKVKVVAKLLHESKYATVYSGAGISKTAGIPDYATRATNSVVAGVNRLGNPLSASPTRAHRAIARLYREGLIRAVVNQNHDSLYEKCGIPPTAVNEIHGSWFDLANPVVQFSGSLRGDLFNRMLKTEEKQDLVLVCGTSLSGMNADRLASSARRSVLVNLQKTRLDDRATVRVWAKCDEFFALLMKEMGFTATKEEEDGVFVNEEHFPPRVDWSKPVMCPYDAASGRRFEDKPKRETALDLSIGSVIEVVHPLASNRGAKFTVAEEDEDGNLVCISVASSKPGKLAVHKRMGRWYIAALARGELEFLPIANATTKE